MRDGLPLQCRHSEERGVSLRPTSWPGQRFDFFVWCSRLVFCLWLSFVCGLVTPAQCGMVFFCLWFLIFFVYGLVFIIFWGICQSAFWNLSADIQVCLSKSRHSEERGVYPRSKNWRDQGLRFVLFGCSRLMRDGFI